MKVTGYRSADAAALLGISETTLRRLIHAGLVDATKVGRVWVVPVAAVKAHLRLMRTPVRGRR